MTTQSLITRTPLVLALVAFACASAGDSREPIEVSIHQPDRVDPGFLFWHQSDELQQDVENISVLVDSTGKLVHKWPTDLTGGGTPAYLLDEGRVLRTGILDRRNVAGGPIASTDAIQVVDAHGNVIWQFLATQLENTLFHHDMEPMPNGHFLVTTYKRLSAGEARALGWDADGRDEVWADGVMELAPNFETGGGEIVWEWSFADHLIQDRFPDAPNYGVIAEHPERIDPHFPESYAPLDTVRQHINSVDYNADLDQVLLSSFIYDEIWIVGRSGEILFRYGNPAAYGMGTADDRVFLKQHDANWIDEGLPGAGNILVHNNNTIIRPRRPAQPSAENMREIGEIEVEETRSNVYELALPSLDGGTYSRSGNSAYEAETAWYWEHPDYFADFQGGARRLPNGNTLISDTTDYHVVEVTSDGEIVAEYKGTTPVFKAYKYPAAHISALTDATDQGLLTP